MGRGAAATSNRLGTRLGTILDLNREASPNRKDLSDQSHIDDECARFITVSKRMAQDEVTRQISKAKIIQALGKAEHGQTALYNIHAPEQGRGDTRFRVLRSIRPGGH